MEHGFSSLTSVDQEDDQDYSPENSADSPSSGHAMFYDTSKTTSTSSNSPKKSRRSLQKRVVSVPIKEIEGSRLKNEINAPPSDSWAWRKYGQKPIKGSPYPRGYYRCSSSKGCPARKQVERSRSDPTMVIVTYSCDHNHSWPAANSRNNHHHNSTVSPPPAAITTTTTQEAVSNTDDQEEVDPTGQHLLIKQSKAEEPEFTSLEVGQCPLFVTTSDQFGWFSYLESPSSTMLESPLLAGDIVGDADMAMIFSIREEDESLFADLGELPECTTVFRRKEVINQEEHHHRRACSLAPWCGTKG